MRSPEEICEEGHLCECKGRGASSYAEGLKGRGGGFGVGGGGSGGGYERMGRSGGGVTAGVRVGHYYD